MAGDIWFKCTFVAAFAFATTIATSAAKRARSVHGGSLNYLTHEVRGLIAVRALLGLIFYAALGTWLFASRCARWSYLPLPSGVRWIAVALLVPVLAFFAWSFRSLGPNYRGGVGLYPNHALVTIGPYRWIRHPIYAAFIAIMVLVTMLSANWVLGGAGVLLVGSIAAGRIAVEERELHERFGMEWEAYRSRTRRLVPW